MQNIRRSTKKHRKVLLAVVLLLMLGLVGSFATWGSRSGLGGVSSGSGVDGYDTLEQQISLYFDYVKRLEAEANDFSAYVTIASNYRELSTLYMNKYNNDSSEIIALDPPEYDEEGNEIPLEPEQQAERALAEETYNAAVAAAEVWLDASHNSAGWAADWYQKALDNAPADISDIGIADIKFNQAEARYMQDEKEIAVLLLKEANELDEDNINYILNLAYMEQELGDLEGALACYEQASDMYPENANFVATKASLNADMGNTEKASVLYKEARAMAPEDADIAYSYASFIFFSVGYEEGLDEMRAFRASLPEESPALTRADEGLANLQSWADLFASLVVEPTDEDSDADTQDKEAADENQDTTGVNEEEVPDQQ